MTRNPKFPSFLDTSEAEAHDYAKSARASRRARKLTDKINREVR